MSLELPAPTNSSVLGAHLTAEGARFALWAPRASRVELALIDEDRNQQNVEMSRHKDGVWTASVAGVKAEQRYGYRVHGDWDPDSGQRFNPAKLLLDPYARAITAGVDYAGPIRDHTPESNYLPDPVDSAFSVPLSVVVEETPPPPPIARRKTLAETVLYETHVKGFTLNHPAVPEHLRGTYGGLAYPAVIDHLKRVGVTAIELLPVHHFVSEPFIVGRGLSNFWGYNTLGFFAPHASYTSESTLGGQVREFKEMVRALHEADIEVILDVVYNHTGEGGHEGPTLGFRGIDHGGYYRLTPDMRNDYDVTGCGDSVDTSQPGVLAMIIDSLRYWVKDMGVDGFRFDLATTLIRNSDHHVDHEHPFKKILAEDPDFEGIKMISEPWDMGPYGYQVGHWGPGWSEWNDRFRGFTRDLWRGEVTGVQEFATRLAGSPDIFGTPGRNAEASINFVTAHDGFTMRDLVTYNHKHNHANGERNRDGSDDNRSWNCGFEGETEDLDVTALRRRQIKNLLSTLILSIGVPMIVAGDEFGRTQQGNNNAYCQDSPISWVDWTSIDEWSDVTDLTSTLLKLRADSPLLRPRDFMIYEAVTDAEGNETGQISLTWMNEAGTEIGEEQWHDHDRRTLGMYRADADHAFLIWFHTSPEPIQITLPKAPWADRYEVLSYTGEMSELDGLTWLGGDSFELPGRSVLVLSAIQDESVRPAEEAATSDPVEESTEVAPDSAAQDADDVDQPLTPDFGEEQPPAQVPSA